MLPAEITVACASTLIFKISIKKKKENRIIEMEEGQFGHRGKKERHVL